MRDLRLRARPRCCPYLPRAPGSSRTPCFPPPTRSKCRSTPLTRWRPRELQGNTLRLHFPDLQQSKAFQFLLGANFDNWAFKRSPARLFRTRQKQKAAVSLQILLISPYSLFCPRIENINKKTSFTKTLLASRQQPVPSFPRYFTFHIGLQFTKTGAR